MSQHLKKKGRGKGRGMEEKASSFILLLNLQGAGIVRSKVAHTPTTPPELAWKETAEKSPRHANWLMLTPTASAQEATSAQKAAGVQWYLKTHSIATILSTSGPRRSSVPAWLGATHPSSSLEDRPCFCLGGGQSSAAEVGSLRHSSRGHVWQTPTPPWMCINQPQHWSACWVHAPAAACARGSAACRWTPPSQRR